MILKQSYLMRFTAVGNNGGDYIVANSIIVYMNTWPQLMEFHKEVLPIIQLIAPNKIQIATFLVNILQPIKHWLILKLHSNNDNNLFSTIDDANNTGISAKINAKQRLVSKKWNLDATTNYQFIQQSFRSVERLYSIILETGI
jgi:hypothetical protein